MFNSRDCVDCGDDGPSQRNFEDRLITFVNWTNNVSPQELASAGFYYTRREDIVRYAFCHCKFNNWKESDNPLEDQYKYINYFELANVLWKSRQIKKGSKMVGRKENKDTSYTYKVSSLGTCLTLALFMCGLFHSYKSIIDFAKYF